MNLHTGIHFKGCDIGVKVTKNDTNLVLCTGGYGHCTRDNVIGSGE